MRMVFLGAGEFGLPTLAWLCTEHEVVGVVSQPDKPAGRKRVLTPTAIAQFALERRLPLLRVENINTAEGIEQLKAMRAEASVVIAFGQKLSPGVIEAGGGLVVNLHASLLPKYRGAAPINWAMIEGEKETGVSVIGLAQRMDAGLVYAQVRAAIDPLETAGELHDRLARMGPGAIGSVLRDYQQGALHGVAQDESLASKAPKLSKADGWVDWGLPAEQVVARIHGLTPWPGVRVNWVRGDGGAVQELILRRAKVMEGVSAGQVEPGGVLEGGCVATGAGPEAGVVRLLEVQKPGGRVLGMDEFLRGHEFCEGDRLERGTMI